MGSVFVASVQQFSISNRRADPPCIPEWRATSACIGDCRVATQTLFQTNCPLLPPTSVTDCKKGMPCTCLGRDLPLDGTVVTCGDCTVVEQGQSCFFRCLDPFSTLSSSMTNHITCLASGWASVTDFPSCRQILPTCPPIVSGAGVVTKNIAGVHCANALEGQICRTTCGPGFFNPEGFFQSTCTMINNTLTWFPEMRCVCQQCGTLNDVQCATQL